MADFRYVSFEHSRPWLIHSYKKVSDNTMDLVDGSRMEQLLKAPIQAGKSWPDPENVEEETEEEISRKRKTEEEEEEDVPSKKVRSEESEVFFEAAALSKEDNSDDILRQPGVHDTYYGAPNAAELMVDSSSRAKKNAEEKRKRKEEMKRKEIEKKREIDELKKRIEDEEKLEQIELKKAAEEEMRMKEEAEKKKEEEDEEKRKEEEKMTKIKEKERLEVVIQSLTPDNPPGGEELMALAKMANTTKPPAHAKKAFKSYPKRSNRVPPTSSACPEAQQLVALAKMAEKDKAKATRKPRTSRRRHRSPEAPEVPEAPEAPQFVSVLKPDLYKEFPQVDGPASEEVAENAYLGSFNRVRLLCRPWRVTSGGINRPALRLMLEAVCMQAMSRPGVTINGLFAFFQPALHVTPLMELLEILECVGCVERKFIARQSRSSLFSKRCTLAPVTQEKVVESDAAILPKIDCILKLGHFIQMLSEEF